MDRNTIQRKIRKYQIKISNAIDTDAQLVYQNKLARYEQRGGGCSFGGKSGVYIIFTIADVVEFIDFFKNDPNSTFNSLNSVFSGLYVKVGAEEFKLLECATGEFPQFCRIPRAAYTDIAIKMPTIGYSYILGTGDVQSAKNDLNKYVETKQAEIDSTIGQIGKMMTGLKEYAARRTAELNKIEQCVSRKDVFPKIAEEQKKFNVNVRAIFPKRMFGVDMPTSAITNATIETCKQKRTQIIDQLRVTNPTAFANIEPTVNKMTIAFVIDMKILGGGDNKLLNVYDLTSGLDLLQQK